MSNETDKEHGYKWWLRYVVIPLVVACVGGGGVVAIIAALIPILIQPGNTSQPAEAVFTSTFTLEPPINTPTIEPVDTLTRVPPTDIPIITSVPTTPSVPPTPIPTHTPDSTLIRTMPPLSELNILFYDDFSTVDNDWGELENIAFIGQGKYRHVVEKEYWTYRLGLPDRTFGNVLISVNATIAEAYGDGGLAIFFRRNSDEGFYDVAFTRRGQLLISWCEPTEECHEIYTEQFSDVRLEEGVKNNFAVMTVGTQISVFFNEKWLTSVDDATLNNDGLIGLAAFNWDGTRIIVDFDDVTVYEIE